MAVPPALMRLGVEEWKCVIAMEWAGGDVQRAGSFIVDEAGQPDQASLFARSLARSLPRSLAPSCSLALSHRGCE